MDIKRILENYEYGSLYNCLMEARKGYIESSEILDNNLAIEGLYNSSNLELNYGILIKNGEKISDRFRKMKDRNRPSSILYTFRINREEDSKSILIYNLYSIAIKYDAENKEFYRDKYYIKDIYKYNLINFNYDIANSYSKYTKDILNYKEFGDDSLNDFIERFRYPILETALLYRGDKNKRNYSIGERISFTNEYRRYRAFTRDISIAKSYSFNESLAVYDEDNISDGNNVIYALSTIGIEGTNLRGVTRYNDEKEISVYTSNKEFEVVSIVNKDNYNLVFIKICK